MAKNVSPNRWHLFFFVPVIILLSCFFVYQTLYTVSAAKDPAPLNSDFYTLTTARGTELLSKPIVGNCFI